jgi:1-acyl-sn-glycerol-3-phosphate acyltransferase
VLRPLLSAVVFFFLTIVLSIVAMLSGLVDRSGDLVLKLARVWSRAVLGAAGVRLRVRAHAPHDPKRPYVFMSNHLSAVDIWAVFLAVSVPMRFIAKKQLGQIPIFGWAMRAGRFIFIDRQNTGSARRTIDEAAQRIRSGCSVVIFPEGTRSRDGSLLPFKKGGFHLAMSSGADIVPVAIRGSRAIMPSGSLLIHAGVVDLEIGEPIPTEGLAADARDALIAQVRGRIQEMLARPADAALPGGPPDSIKNA